MTRQRALSFPQASVSRRDFVKAVGAAAAVSTVPGLGQMASAAPTPKSAAETVVGQFYGTLTDAQKKDICFGFEDEKRKKLDANWMITKHKIGSDFYTDEQRQLIDNIVREVSSEDGYGRFKQQMKEDRGGMENYSVAMFGEPGGDFQWELTGRHLTLRADGDSVKNMAFGGPIVYGHGVGNPAKNLFYYQTKQANEVFGSLEGKQREQALIKDAPSEWYVPLQGAEGKFAGIPVADLSGDQKELVQATVKTLLAPYREEDVEEVMSLLKEAGGVDSLNMAFYQEDDLNNDKVWDIWRVEGPNFVWHFRGAPHVHTYVNIGIKQA